MCKLKATHLICICPERDTLRCPHHIFVRTRADIPVHVRHKLSPTGYFLRRPKDFQRRFQWEPLEESLKWLHCAFYKKENVKADGTLQLGLESTCPATIRGMTTNTCALVSHVRGLCDECKFGHGTPEPEATYLVLETEWEKVSPPPEKEKESPSPAENENDPPSPRSCDGQDAACNQVPENRAGFLSRIFKLITGNSEPDDEKDTDDCVFVSAVSSIHSIGSDMSIHSISSTADLTASSSVTSPDKSSAVTSPNKSSSK
ncbi:hypothetical protein MFIFM68171_08407 [Madurella fahalii]|uniref:SWIM-type domain-containing protein n=1 Tax=Madurella fahalii TaxID=1157608 RepID=A0ABQ0GKA4_9PEZI